MTHGQEYLDRKKRFCGNIQQVLKGYSGLQQDYCEEMLLLNFASKHQALKKEKLPFQLQYK